MHAITTLATPFLALLAVASAMPAPQTNLTEYGSAIGYSGEAVDGICEGDVVGTAITIDQSQSDCVTAPANCIRGSTTSGPGQFSGQCWVDVWSQPGCPGESESWQVIEGEAVFGASNVQSWKVGCQLT